MTMEIERRHAPVPGELLEYLRANPTAAQQAADGGVHVHVHHHYAAPEPIPAGAVVHQGAQPTVAERVIPWLWTALVACVVLTLCAAVLAAVMIVAVAVLAAVVLLGLVVAYIINSQGSTAMAKATAGAMLDKGKHKRR
jgi:hypothetical protein